MPFHFKENIITADLAFEATGKTPTLLFKECANAIAAESANPKTIAAKIKKAITLKEESIEKLLFEFLEELIYIKDTKGMVYAKFDIHVEEGTERDRDKKKNKGKKQKAWRVKCTAYGDTIDRTGKKKQELLHDLKAVTLHRFSVKKEKGMWKAFVVIDL